MLATGVSLRGLPAKTCPIQTDGEGKLRPASSLAATSHRHQFTAHTSQASPREWNQRARVKANPATGAHATSATLIRWGTKTIYESPVVPQ